MLDGRPTATEFYADAEGHPDQPALQRALEELRFSTRGLKMLGTFPAGGCARP